MSNQRQPAPTLEEFLRAPAGEVAKVAPATVVLAAGGTRREAVLQNIGLRDYFGWSMDRMLDVVERIAALGVRDLFVSILRSTQVAERGAYGQQLWDAVDRILGDPARIERIAQANLQVRTFGSDDFPEIGGLIDRVSAATQSSTGMRWWWMFSATPQAPWNTALRAIVAAGATTQKAAVQVVYGADVAPVGVYLGFGKPLISPELLPPLLEGDTTAVWYQQPGYLPITDTLLRQVFFEAAYVRQTWHVDKTQRYTAVPSHKDRWNQLPTLGLGRVIDTFWFPKNSNESEWGSL